MKHKLVICIFSILFLAQPAFAFEKLFSKYCQGSKVPTALAMAIARHESGLNPLCINVAGKDYWPETEKDAALIIKKAQEQNKSYDVGLMQINSQWVKIWGIDPVTLLDPETNIRYGIRLLKEEVDRYGLNWRAVGSYHSPNPIRGRYYAGMVSKHLKANAELKSKMANPRLAHSFTHLRHKTGFASLKMDRGLTSSHAHLQRQPIGWEHSSYNGLHLPKIAHKQKR